MSSENINSQNWTSENHMTSKLVNTSQEKHEKFEETPRNSLESLPNHVVQISYLNLFFSNKCLHLLFAEIYGEFYIPNKFRAKVILTSQYSMMDWENFWYRWRERFPLTTVRATVKSNQLELDRDARFSFGNVKFFGLQIQSLKCDWLELPIY